MLKLQFVCFACWVRGIGQDSLVIIQLNWHSPETTSSGGSQWQTWKSLEMLWQTSHRMTHDGFGSGSMVSLGKDIVGECQCQVMWWLLGSPPHSAMTSWGEGRKTTCVNWGECGGFYSVHQTIPFFWGGGDDVASLVHLLSHLFCLHGSKRAASTHWGFFFPICVLD